MKYKTLQILWHERKPALTAEFLEDNILATGGADHVIRTWKVATSESGDPSVSLESELSGMEGSINCIRLSPKGDIFAASGDKGEVVLWKRNLDYREDNEGEKYDVFDISWSSDGTCLATANLEGVVILWDTIRKKEKGRLYEHHHYVQGVSWDPFNQYIVSQGSDRRCKIYTLPSTNKNPEAASKQSANWKVSKTLFKMRSHNREESVKNFMFYDDTLKSFFRRLDWSPEGSFLVIPSGLWKEQENKALLNVAYVYSRGNWSAPIACLPAPGEPFVIVRFCPVLFKNSKNSSETDIIDLPYEMLFACATLHSIVLYKSGELTPILLINGIHYSEITDLAWSPNGKFLAVSSADGYCSLVHLEEADLGPKLEHEHLKENSATVEWFTALQEIRNQTDIIVVKKRTAPQRVTKAEEKQEPLEEKSTRPKRRITPIAISVEDTKEPSCVYPALESSQELHETKITELLNTQQPMHEQCSDLQSFLTEEGSNLEQQSEERTLSEFWSMTAAYANRRF